jgi:HSP20 family protein
MSELIPFGRKHPFGKRGVASPWDELDRAVERFFGQPFFSPFFHQDPMKVDIKETETQYIVEAEIPGVKKENIKLDLDDDVLTIHVDQNEQIEEKGVNYIRKERKTASFSRSFYVENVNPEQVSAKYENGILKVVLPKKEKGLKRGKSINID